MLGRRRPDHCGGRLRRRRPAGFQPYRPLGAAPDRRDAGAGGLTEACVHDVKVGASATTPA